MPFISIWMELENTILSEMSKKKNLHNITYVLKLKNKINKCIQQTKSGRYRKEDTDVEEKPVDTMGKAEGRMN